MPTDVETQAKIRIIYKKGNKLTDEEIRKIFPLFRRYFENVYSKTDVKLDYCIEELKRRKHHLLIAQKEDTGEFVGMIEVSGKKRLKTLRVVIKEEYEGKGLGKRLIRNKLALAMRLGAGVELTAGLTERGKGVKSEHDKLAGKLHDIERLKKWAKEKTKKKRTGRRER